MAAPLVFGPGATKTAPIPANPSGKPLVFGPGAKTAAATTGQSAAIEPVMKAIDILQRNPQKQLQHGIALTHLRTALTELQQMPKA